MVIDIDSGDSEETDYAVYSVEILKKLFDCNNTPYHLRFSGRGFHFVIPYKYFEHLNKSFNPHEDNNIYAYMSDIADILHDDLSEMIDTSVYDSRRVLKIPFSLSIYQNESFICSPIKDLPNFKLSDYIFKNGMIPELSADTIFNADGNINLFKNMGAK